jgi:hypothetical protein
VNEYLRAVAYAVLWPWLVLEAAVRTVLEARGFDTRRETR